ncbi:hypothetical protein [Halorussus pelagicus]|uniref:hypothetical protein n=1 Tax=Halorussus pelagicus TaxID=2505977 RepID=UPI000FFC3CAA|nr:hypothetical protein [Halorussus pelagicus]
MGEKDSTSRRSVLKSASVAFVAGTTALATAGNASASHNEWNVGDIVSTDGKVPGWTDRCGTGDFDRYIDGQPGEIVDGPCYNGSYKFWKVELSNLGDVRWFRQDFLTNERDG